MYRLATALLAGSILWFTISAAPHAAPQQPGRVHTPELFQTADNCIACHSSLITSSGADVSIGADWRSSMMAHSSRDPYWQASVRRETMDHMSSRAAIEDECSICHMPMATAQAKAEQREGQVFAHLPVGQRTSQQDLLAADGVSCTMCHQITDSKFGTPESFTGGFVVDTTKSGDDRQIYGRYKIDAGRTTIMRSSAGFSPTESMHVQQSELCATCHTLYTKALGPQGEVIGTLPEQVPYLEWQHSAYKEEKSCQACHMPVVEEKMPIVSVLGEQRESFFRHVFVGGNFFMLRMLNRYRADLGVTAPSRELDSAIQRTQKHLQTETAAISVERSAVSNGRIDIDVAVQNLAGHKLPTGYPSRRSWIHLTVRDQAGRQIFESGGLNPNGQIQGNDGDTDPLKFEPHYAEIRQQDQVQIYESVMGDANGVPTTGLLKGLRFIKDNRLLPRGFDKATAVADIAVVGEAASDADFIASGDRVRYSVDASGAEGPFQIEAELRYQPLSFRWADNLRQYESVETRRFVSYYDSMSSVSSEVLAHASAAAR